MNETPEIVPTAYVTTTSTTGDSTRQLQVEQSQPFRVGADVFEYLDQKINQAVADDPIHEDEDMSGKRMVRVLIVDPDTQVPVYKSVLHDSKEILTDLTDEELFFEVDLKSAVTRHNVYRGTLKDKDGEAGDMLEAIRIRDLKMLVVTLAEF
jgi:hypothetical protein